MLSSRRTGPALIGVAAAAAIAGGDPGLLVVAAIALGFVAGAGRVQRGRSRERRETAIARGGGYWRARLPVQTATLIWPDAPGRLALYGPVPVTLTAGPAGLAIHPSRAPSWFAGLAPRWLGWQEVLGARRWSELRPGPAEPDRGGVLIDLVLARAGTSEGGPAASPSDTAVLVFADQPDGLVAYLTMRTGR